MPHRWSHALAFFVSGLISFTAKTQSQAEGLEAGWRSIPTCSGRALALPTLQGSVIASRSWKICYLHFSSLEQAFCRGLFSALSQLVDLGERHWCFSWICRLLAPVLVSWWDILWTRRAKAGVGFPVKVTCSFKWSGWPLCSCELSTVKERT